MYRFKVLQISIVGFLKIQILLCCSINSAEYFLYIFSKTIINNKFAVGLMDACSKCEEKYAPILFYGSCKDY